MNRSAMQAAILSLGLLAAASCNQSDIFFKISKETEPIPPLIPGSPTNMVVVERTYNAVAVPIMYVASGKLYWYAKAANGNPRWHPNTKKYPIEYPIKPPGGRIVSLAVDKNNRLYALCIIGSGVNTSLRYIESDENEWKTISFSAAGNIQSIYVDLETDRLFAGVRRGSAYDIFYLESKELKKLQMGSELSSILSGTVHRNGVHYLCTQDTGTQDTPQGNGIYTVNENDILANNSELSATQLVERSVTHDYDEKKISSPQNNRNFMGMIKLKDETIIAIERIGGALFKVNPDSFEQIPCWNIRVTKDENGTEKREEVDKDWMKTDRYATGALALWENSDANSKALIAGIQGGLSSTSSSSSYTHGYVEFALKGNNSKGDNPDSLSDSPRRKVSEMQSVDDSDQYTASLGKHPIKHLYQAPKKIDDEMTLFASTQTGGLWSYKKRTDNKKQWNAEN